VRWALDFSVRGIALPQASLGAAPATGPVCPKGRSRRPFQKKHPPSKFHKGQCGKLESAVPRPQGCLKKKRGRPVKSAKDLPAGVRCLVAPPGYRFWAKIQ